MRANHNKKNSAENYALVVSNVPKILKWEQITTGNLMVIIIYSCFQCSKDTKMRANHNIRCMLNFGYFVVSNVPKILKWEQITTKTWKQI